jgi:hypothetical protein
MIITFFKSEIDTYVPAEMSIDTTWNKIVTMLTTFIEVPNKEDTEMYNLWEFKSENEIIHRCRDDCIALHGLVLDYDKNLSLIDAIKQFAGFECIIYTTFNYEFNVVDRYRIVLPFITPMPINEFNKKRKSMIEAFPGVDKASFTRSQAVFLHSGKDKSNAFAEHMNGIYLDWTVFEDEIIVPYVPSDKVNISNDPVFESIYRDAVIKSLMSCKDFRHTEAFAVVTI